jgi:hypothetical protein
VADTAAAAGGDVAACRVCVGYHPIVTSTAATRGVLWVPDLGDEAVAYRMTIGMSPLFEGMKPLRMTMRAVLVRVGNVLSMVTVGDMGGDDTSATDDLAHKAVAKVKKL